MLKLQGYHVKECLYKGVGTQVFRALREEDGKKVILKYLPSDYPHFQEILKYRHQYKIAEYLANQCNCPGVVPPLTLMEYGNSVVLVSEDVGGVVLKEYMQTHSVSIEEFLQIAIALTQILHHLYTAQIIHKDIKPSNILIHQETFDVWLIDFSVASQLAKETPTLTSPQNLEGTLAYMSPEQTGRMNRGIDYRSDFYSLGVTLYHLLTGKLPFPYTEPMELVHAHLAQPPTPPNQYRPDIPPPLTEILLKLLSKTPEDRYQTAYGLEHDLRHCLEEWQKNGDISPFPLAQQDISDHFQIPDKLYGRDAETQTLLDAFQQTTQGKTQILMVAGYSGIGKTALVNEVQKPIVAARGYFITGKYDQFQRNIPFSALVHAFSDFVQQLLSESATAIAQWKTKILKALGKQAQVLIEVIPELELLLGPQPPVPALDATAARNRFNLLFQRFIQVLPDKTHPLVIFLDDLQWADAASLKLLNLVFRETSTHHLLLIGSYRDNEVSKTHPLLLTLDELQKQKIPLKTIHLKPLDPESINQLISDTLKRKAEETWTLVQRVQDQTQGNPFFMAHFLKSLYAEDLIYFDLEKRQWDYNLSVINQLSFTDDVVEFIAQKMRQLPASLQQCLQLAACIGNQFNRNTLAIVGESSPETITQQLWKAVQEEYIFPLHRNHQSESQVEDIQYQFYHDRIQHAAYSLIPEAHRQKTHLKIGKLLWENTPNLQESESLFDVVNHFNQGISLVEDYAQKKEIAKLNLLAGCKAKNSTAYQAANEYLETGLNRLNEKSWQNDYNLTFSLHKELAEVSYLEGDFNRSKFIIKNAIEKVKTDVEKAEFYRILVIQHTLSAEYQKAIQTGLQALSFLEIHINPKNYLADIEQEQKAIQNQLKNVDNQEVFKCILNLPLMTDEIKAMSVKVLISLDPPTYITGQAALYQLVTLKATRLSLIYGNTAESVKAYANYGLIVGAIFGDYQLGYQFGKVAVKLSQILQSPNQKCQACLLLASWHYTWAKHNQGKPAALNLEGYQAGLEGGEIQFAGYNLFARVCNQIFQGLPLEQVLEESYKYQDFGKKTQNRLLCDTLLGIQLVYTPLVKGIDEKLFAQESEFITNCQAMKTFLGLNIYYIGKMQQACVLERWNEGLQCVRAIQSHLESSFGFTMSALYPFYASLIILNLYPTLTRQDKALYGEKLTEYKAQLQVWQESCPENFEQKLALVEAENYRIRGQFLEAMETYDYAIASSQKHKFPQDEALAQEYAARFYLSWEKSKIAQIYLTDAYYAYLRWGATGKVAQLEQKYSSLLQPLLEKSFTSPSVPETTIPSKSSQTFGDNLDLNSIIKATQTLSGQIERDRLLSLFLDLLMENAGASKAAILLDQGENLQVSAIAKPQKAIHFPKQPLETCPDLPHSLLHYVWRTGKTLVYNNVPQDIPQSHDPYLENNSLQSILCQPIQGQGKRLGILYLENRFTKGAFPQNRFTLLNILSTQTAISLENAQLYEEATTYTQQLQASLQQLQQAQVQLVQSEKMASVGQLVSGIAHEINNPVNFISGNIACAKQYIDDILSLLTLYQEKFPDPGEDILEEIEEIDLEYLHEDLPKLITSMQEGANRITQISHSMRVFSRSDSDRKTRFDIHAGLDSTLLILTHRLKAKDTRPAIQIIKKYSDLPEITGYPGQLNQVFMNLLANAIDAVEDTNEGRTFAEIEKQPNQIIIETNFLENSNQVHIYIRDNGAGIPPEIQKNIFDNLFTTKAMGKGTGLGLSIVKQIIEEKHKGRLMMGSYVGQGTDFQIILPVEE